MASASNATQSMRNHALTPYNSKNGNAAAAYDDAMTTTTMMLMMMT